MRALLLGIAVWTGAVAEADSYRITAIKNCDPFYGDRRIEVGAVVSEPSLLDPRWKKSKGSRYIKLRSIYNNVEQVISAPRTHDDDEGFLAWAWDAVKDQVKGVFRAPDSEAFGGLADNLSQTFYLVGDDGATIDIASTLPEGTILTFASLPESKSFTATIENGHFAIPLASLQPDYDAEGRSIRTFSVNIETSDGSIPVTDTMTVIILEP